MEIDVIIVFLQMAFAIVAVLAILGMVILWLERNPIDIKSKMLKIIKGFNEKDL